MSNYTQRVSDNILPLSIAVSLPEAFEEWSFTENTVDHERPIETCKLCDKEKVRYHFEIRNAQTENTLWVGSHCILQFGLSVFENGRRLSPTSAKRKLDRLTKKMRLESCLKALERLATAENNDILTSALDYYRKKKYLTPKFAAVVLWRLHENGIDHAPSFFKVSLKRDKYKRDLRDMRLISVQTIWPALSPAQRRMAISMGHHAPVSPP